MNTLIAAIFFRPDAFRQVASTGNLRAGRISFIGAIVAGALGLGIGEAVAFGPEVSDLVAFAVGFVFGAIGSAAQFVIWTTVITRIGDRFLHFTDGVPGTRLALSVAYAPQWLRILVGFGEAVYGFVLVLALVWQTITFIIATYATTDREASPNAMFTILGLNAVGFVVSNAVFVAAWLASSAIVGAIAGN